MQSICSQNDNFANQISELYNALEEAGTVRYNPSNDMIELKFNGKWYEWKKAFLQAISIYAEGVINTDLVGDLIDSGSAGTSGSVSFDTNCITINASGTTSSARRQTVRSENTINLTDIETICADFSMEIESTSTAFNLAVSTTIPNDVTTITNKVELNSGGTAQLNVSGLTGNYYLFAFVTSKVSGQVVRVSNIYMS